LGACSSDASDANPQGNAGSTGNGSCPDMGGPWSVSEHCDSSLVGEILQVTQTACALSFAAPFDVFTGSLSADGKIALSGPQTCTGTLTASTASLNCTDECIVKLTRLAR
jgi:hypothetical protein